MSARLLYVDDEASLVTLVQEQLADVCTVDVASDAQQGLESLRVSGPYSIVLSDMRMPGLTGIEFLSRVRALAPESVRMLITAHADVPMALEAVNIGNVFRLLTKPCSHENLLHAVRAGLEQYQLIVVQRELLEKTLAGSVQVLMDTLSVIDPAGFGCGLRMRKPMQLLARALGVPRSWELDVATMLSQLGRVGLPDELLVRVDAGQQLSDAERRVVNEAPELAFRLLQHVPRLDPAARVVRYQGKNFDGSGPPNDDVAGDDIPLGSRMLRVVADLVALESQGFARPAALAHLRQCLGHYDEVVLSAAERVFGDVRAAAPELTRVAIPLCELRVGHVLLEPVTTLDATVLLQAGAEVTATNVERLRTFARLQGIREPIVIAG